MYGGCNLSTLLPGRGSSCSCVVTVNSCMVKRANFMSHCPIKWSSISMRKHDHSPSFGWRATYNPGGLRVVQAGTGTACREHYSSSQVAFSRASSRPTTTSMPPAWSLVTIRTPTSSTSQTLICWRGTQGCTGSPRNTWRSSFPPAAHPHR